MPRFDALVINPNSSARGALKELLHNEQQYGENVYKSVYLAQNTMDGLTKLIEVIGIDVLFISDRLPFEEIQQFIQTAKALEGDRATAYIVVLDSMSENTAMLSEGLAYGADGFLKLPASVSALREITEISNRVKSQNQERLLKLAINLLVETLIDEIELRADRLRNADEKLGFGRQLKMAVRRMLGDNPESFELYVEVLEAMLQKMPPYTYYIYQGSSERVRRRFEEELRVKSA